jgi:hypothetical protein
MKHICINKDDVIENFMNLCEFIKENDFYEFARFGFYFKKSFMDVELWFDYDNRYICLDLDSLIIKTSPKDYNNSKIGDILYEICPSYDEDDSDYFGGK